MKQMIMYWFERLKDLGIEPHFSERKKRAIRISNLLTLNGINICALFFIAFMMIHEYPMVLAVGVCALAYVCGLTLTAMRWTLLGRSVTLIGGCLCIMHVALYYGGEAHIQFLLLCMASVPLIMIEWESLKLIIFLQSVPVLMVIICEVTNYSLYNNVAPTQDLRVVQMLSLFIGFTQTLFGYYLFARQSVFFENETMRYIKALDVEHSKQIQIQKMSALGEMSGGVAHEINNPLAIIAAKCDQMIKRIKSSDYDQSFLVSGLQKILETNDRIAKIVTALRVFSREAENDPITQVDLLNVVEDVLSLSEERMKHSGIAIEKIVDSKLHILGRPTHLSQILVNLLNNSYDAIGGTPNAWIKIEAKRRNSHIDIYVTDSGKGIPSDICDKIMQPFFTTKELNKGTGLGLSISKGLAESMNGELKYVKYTANTQFLISLKAV